jgi:NAD(P)-dependent dehydrogenase (short-subunit alcohol dehydrogenase family)
MINSAYMASKAAINRFTEALAAEARSHGVSVFAVSPGTVKTNMIRVAFADDWDDPDLWSPPELAAGLIACIGSGALDDFSGKYIHAANDDWRAMARG